MPTRLWKSIKAGLILKGETQGALAENLDVSENTVSNWMQGKNFPDRESLLALKEYFSWSQEALTAIVEDWVVNGHGAKEYRIAGHDYVAERYERNYEEFLADLINLDFDTVGGLSLEHEGSPEQWAPIYESCTTTWRLLLISGEIAGYWHFMCLHEEFYNDIMCGNLVDSELDIDMMNYPVMKGNYCAYFVIITTRHADQGPAATRRLLKSLEQVLCNFAEDGVFMEKIGATAFSHQGRQLCKHMGMKYLGRHSRAPKNEVADLFEMTGSEMVRGYMGRNPKLRALYQSNFSH